ncbi:hypothetical protein Tco_0715574 [Tanacetum coccineum]
MVEEYKSIAKGNKCCKQYKKAFRATPPQYLVGTHRGIHAGWQNSVARIVAAQLEHQASMNLKNYCCLVLHLD